MKINIICIGNLKEEFMKDAANEYLKRINRFIKINVIELKEERLKEENSVKEEDRVKEVETNNIIETLKKINSSYNILLDVSGKELSSEGFASKIREIKDDALMNVKEINFIIGGSLGFTDELRKNADLRLSFSKMTFPHQLMRVILLEQVYRAFKIINNESYHK